MQSQPQLHDLLRTVTASQLETPFRDEHLAEIASMIVRWETFSPFMSIGEAEEEEIRADYRTSYHQQKLACLRKWKAKYGYNATYKHLIEIFHKACEVDLCCKVTEMLTRMTLVSPMQQVHIDVSYRAATGLEHVALVSPQMKNELDTYHQYLVEQYLQELPPGTAEFPFTAAHSFQYIELSLLAKTRAGVASIKMQDIITYREGERKVTLLQGAAGSGKSTLVWEFKRRWARGELYPEIQFLICINLRDPNYHMAKALADIIPCLDDEMKKTAVAHMKKCFGAGVGFILDGWDEVPYKYQRRSYVYNLVAGKIGDSLPRAKFLVTSRSIGTTIIRGIAPKHIEIESLSPQQITEYFTRHTDLGISDVEEYAKQNEHFFLLCDLPVNASIVSHTLQDPRLKQDKLFPETQTELYRNLTINLLRSEADRRSDMDDPEVLPDSSISFFRKLSSLAYDGLTENKSLFFKEDLVSHKIDVTGLDHTQGLMVANPVFTSLGLDKSYTFRHLTFQEYMAADYLSNESPQMQDDALTSIIQKHPDRKQVLGFFAGIAGLKGLNCISIFHKLWTEFLHSRIKTLQDRQLLFHLVMKCTFEAQSDKLLQVFCDSISDTIIDLKQFRLGCQDMIMLGRILGKGCLPSVPHTLDAALCTFDSGALAAFAKELKASTCSPSGLTLVLDNTRLFHGDIEALGALISGTSALTCLSMNGCIFEDRDFDLIQNALSRNSSLKFISEKSSQ